MSGTNPCRSFESSENERNYAHEKETSEHPACPEPDARARAGGLRGGHCRQRHLRRRGRRQQCHMDDRQKWRSDRHRYRCDHIRRHADPATELSQRRDLRRHRRGHYGHGRALDVGLHITGQRVVPGYDHPAEKRVLQLPGADERAFPGQAGVACRRFHGVQKPDDDRAAGHTEVHFGQLCWL